MEMKPSRNVAVPSHTRFCPYAWAIFPDPYAYGLPIQVPRDILASPICVYVTGFWKTDRIVTFHNVQERQLKKFTIDNNSIFLHECVAI